MKQKAINIIVPIAVIFWAVILTIYPIKTTYIVGTLFALGLALSIKK